MDSAIDSALDTATASSGTDGAAGASSGQDTGSASASPAPASAVAAGSAAQSSSTAPPAGATTPPADDDDTITDATTFTLEKHKRILDNARRKEAARVEQQFRSSYGNLTPDQARSIADHVQYIEKHGWAAYARVLHQQFAPQPEPTAPASAERPAPDLYASDGTPAYSAPQLEKLLAWQQAQMVEQINAQLQPLQQTHATVQAREMWNTAVQSAQQQLEEAKTWEGWTDIKDKVADLMRRDGRFSLEGAYNAIFQREYLPALKTRTRQSVLDEIKRTPNGNTARPTGAPRPQASKTDRPRSIDEQIERAWETVMSQQR